MPRSIKQEDANGVTPTRPTVSIYQNSEHVAGLVQQLFDAPLVTGAVREDSDDATTTGTMSAKVAVDAEASYKVPLVGGLGARADIDGAGTKSKVVATGSKSTQSFVYSQAYYLNTIRHALRDRELLKTVRSKADAVGLESGDFIEYRATFAPSELVTVMDVLSPDLVAQITRWIVKRKEIALFDGYKSHEQVQIAALKMNERASATADLARDVTRGVQADFRQDKTREYYGRVGVDDDWFTAITICDNAHFVVDDEDRILDGVFTVLGKVTSPPEEDVPVLQRNKLLRASARSDGLMPQRASPSLLAPERAPPIAPGRFAPLRRSPRG